MKTLTVNPILHYKKRPQKRQR